jgi:secreted trypsin-like serine protease
MLMGKSEHYLTPKEVEKIQLPQLLQQAEIEIMSPDRCSKAYDGSGISINGQDILCAGAVGKGACDGDSGGPLVLTTSHHGYVQIGIVSGQRYCGEPGLYTIYTRVSKYYDWIYGTMFGTIGALYSPDSRTEYSPDSRTAPIEQPSETQKKQFYDRLPEGDD